MATPYNGDNEVTTPRRGENDGPSKSGIENPIRSKYMADPRGTGTRVQQERADPANPVGVE